MKQILILLTIALFTACSSSTPVSTNNEDFVDIHSFFTEEVKRLSNNNNSLFKRTVMDSLTNQDTLEELKWDEELFPFLDIDIKPTVWKTDFKYIEPDLEHEPNETAQVFETTNPNQRVKQFKIQKDDNGSIYRFSASIFDDGKISTTKTLISYTKDIGYTITVDRETKLMGSENYQIVGQFIKK